MGNFIHIQILLWNFPFKFGQSSSGKSSGRVWAGFGLTSGKVRTTLGKSLGKFGHIFTGRSSWPDLTPSSGKVRAKFGLTSGKVRAKFGQFRAKLWADVIRINIRTKIAGLTSGKVRSKNSGQL